MKTDESLLSAEKPQLSVNFLLLTEEHVHQTHTTRVCTVQLRVNTPRMRTETPRATHARWQTECAPPGRDSPERLKAIKTIICSGSGQARGCEGGAATVHQPLSLSNSQRHEEEMQPSPKHTTTAARAAHARMALSPAPVAHCSALNTLTYRC